ncbi:MAG TPA: hydroxyacylglutathione hydrolase [Candidatus Angelobacter sp.]|nr:hydroxyacylglutathione hydrolase [Candidatus Angelobacter sp.]
MALPGFNWLTRQTPSSKTSSTARPTVASKPVSRAANAGARGSRGVVDAYDGVHPDYDLTVGIFPTPKGNYGFLLHDRISGETAIVDPMDAGPIVALARARGCGIHHVLNTHHHNCAGNLALKRATGCTIHGPAAEADRIPGIDIAYKGGEKFTLGKLTGEVLAVPGHTFGHLAFWMPGAGVLFCGDVLTPMGCGRLVEGTPHEMWRSLDLIRNLPPETLIYSGFECAQANGRFALTIDRKNMWLQSRMKRVDQACGAGRASVPVKLEDEHTTNPFLRVDDDRIAAAVGLPGAGPVDVFTELRKRRDLFQLQA